MLISKFNKLIRNKVVWGAFAVIVSLSMVGFFAPQPQEARERRRDGVGTLFGESISREEFARARLFTQSFQPMRGGEEVERLIEEETWRRLAAIRYAEKLGMHVSNDELVETIHGDPSFFENGVFSMQRYQFLIEQQLGIPVSWFEEYIRQEILLDRIRDRVQSSLWIPASELEENAARFTDTYEVVYVKVPLDIKATLSVEVGEDDARAVYDTSPDMFLVPERRRALYAAFLHANYLRPEEITARQIEMRYESDPDRYVFTDPDTGEETLASLEDVSADIRQELAQDEAEAIAAEYAMQLVDELSLLDTDADMQLSSLAAQMNIGVSTSDWLRAGGPAPEDVSAGTAFLQAVFQLSATDPAQSFSFSIPGTNAVYVAQLKDVEEAYVPAFEDVLEDALEVARQQAEEAAFDEYVEALYTRLVETAREDGFFAAAESEDLSVTEIKPFTLYDADPRDIPFFGDIAPDLLPLQSGEMTPPIHTVEGAVIAYVVQREESSAQERLSLKPDIARMMLDGLEQLHFSAWNDAILEEARK